MTKGKCKTMLDIRKVIHRLREGHSARSIQREIGIDRSIIKPKFITCDGQKADFPRQFHFF